MTFKLFKIFASNIFSFSGITDNFKKGSKGIAKAILQILLFLYVIVVFVGVYGVMVTGLYSSLKASNITKLMPLLSMLSSIIVIFFLGFTSVATNYYTGNGEEQFIAMPITPRQFFGAKFGVSVVFESLIGMGLFAISSGVYGFNEGLFTNPLFYVGVLVSAASISLVSVAILYLVIILVLYFMPFLRKKNFLTGIASVFIVIFAIGYGFLSSQIGNMMGAGGMTQLQQFANPVINNFMEDSSKYSFISFLSDALNGKILPILFFIALSAIVIFIYVPLVSSLYIKTLNGFSDIKTKKISELKIEETINDIKTNSIFKALYFRDIKTVLREPTFFANGPLMVFLLPVIIIVSTLFSMKMQGGDLLGELKIEAANLFANLEPETLGKIQYFTIIIGSAISIFMGTSTSLASSSFSREGKALYDLKAMPVTNLTIAKVKFWHAMTYVFISILMTFLIIFGIVIFLKLDLPISMFVKICLMIFVISSLICLVLILIDMFIDTVNPKLEWENPIAAFKQNVNSIIAVFAAIILDGLFVLLGVVVLPHTMIGLSILIGVFVVIAAPLGVLYFKYAEKRITTM